MAIIALYRNNGQVFGWRENRSFSRPHTRATRCGLRARADPCRRTHPPPNGPASNNPNANASRTDTMRHYY